MLGGNLSRMAWKQASDLFFAEALEQAAHAIGCARPISQAWTSLSRSGSGTAFPATRVIAPDDGDTPASLADTFVDVESSPGRQSRCPSSNTLLHRVARHRRRHPAADVVVMARTPGYRRATSPSQNPAPCCRRSGKMHRIGSDAQDQIRIVHSGRRSSAVIHRISGKNRAPPRSASPE